MLHETSINKDYFKAKNKKKFINFHNKVTMFIQYSHVLFIQQGYLPFLFKQ